MITRKIFLFLFCCILSFESNAQVEKSLQGIIVDGNTNFPIEGAYVKSIDNESNAITDKRGSFLIILTNNSTRNDSVLINALGYKSIKIPLSLLMKEPIKLYEDVVTLPEVIVKSSFNWDDFAK
jgi:hypothetical protein